MKSLILCALCFCSSYGLFNDLKTEANKKGIRVGAAVDIQTMREDPDPRYRQILKDEFQVVVNENGLKWGEVHPERERFDWSKADELYELAQANGQSMRGHALVWHSQLASYMYDIHSKEEMEQAIREHISAVVGRYKGKITEWDVVNEAIRSDGGFRDTKIFQVLGEEFIEIAFDAASKADPDALLYLNDYSIMRVNPKSSAIFNLIQRLRAKGVKVDGVGIQPHISWEYDQNHLDSSYENFQRFSDAGIKIAMTETDVFPRELGDSDLIATQQKIYYELAELCSRIESCDQFILWGVTDKYSWVPGRFFNRGNALLFDPNYEKKTLYYAARDGFTGSDS